MTKELKRCRVCGDPLDHHADAFSTCIKKAYDLPQDWPANYDAYLMLCLKQGYLQSYGQDASGLRSIKFQHKEDALLTKDPAIDMAKVILSELAPARDREVTLEPRNLSESIAKEELQEIVDENPPEDDKPKKWWELNKKEE